MASPQLQKLIRAYIGFHRGLHRRFWQQKKTRDPASFLQIITLKYVAEAGKPLVKEVSEHLCITAPSATVLINRLVAAKLLRRTNDDRDRRATRLIITLKGKRALRNAFLQIQKRLADIFRLLTPAQQKQLCVLFTSLTASLHNEL